MLRQLLQFLRRKRREPEPKVRTFRFKYQRHPFDDAQFFEVKAADQEAANTLAREEFEKIFAAHGTVMTSFYPIPS